MGLFSAFGYSASALFGLGILLLPALIQQLGLVPSILVFSAIAILLNLSTYIVLELVEITSEDIVESVSRLSGKKEIAMALFGVFVYSALTAYIVAAGNQLSALLGGDPHYWSTLFFVFAIILALKGLSQISWISSYLSLFLVTTVLFLIPINNNYDSYLVPLFGSLSSLPLFVGVSVFALSLFFSVYHIHRLLRDEKNNLVVIFSSFAFAFAVYLAFGLTAAATSPTLSFLSTVSLVKIYPAFYSWLISLIAIFAFYTSFVAVTHSFLSIFKEYLSEKTLYSFLILPVAVLYLFVRQLSFLNLVELVGRIGGSSLLFFLSLASLAHYKASKKWVLKFPRALSYSLCVIFFLLGVFTLIF